MTYKKRSCQQYVLQSKKVLSKVETKLKAKGKRKPKPLVEPIVEPLVATKEKEEAVSLSRGHLAILHCEGEAVKVSAKTRYETMHTEPLIVTVNVADGKIVRRKFVGPEKKPVWLDEGGKERDKKDVKLKQQRHNGSLAPIVVSRTKV